MINTVDIKRARDAVYTLESIGKPKEVVLIVGSCRCVAYLNYFNRYNESRGRPLRVHYIEPNDYCIDSEGRGLNDLAIAESNPRVLEAIGTATIFIHEHYENYGMFNTNRLMPKNVYQFGMGARKDVSIPNFHDRFVLFSEQIKFRQAELHGLSRDNAVENMKRYGWDAIARFVEVCYASSLPEFGSSFVSDWTKNRYFWTGNHISRHFNLAVFRLINTMFLNLDLDSEFWNGAQTEDLFSKPCAPVTQYDIDAYGLTWPDTPIEPLAL